MSGQATAGFDAGLRSRPVSTGPVIVSIKYRMNCRQFYACVETGGMCSVHQSQHESEDRTWR